MPYWQTVVAQAIMGRCLKEFIELFYGFIVYTPAENPCEVEYLLAGICGTRLKDL
jgi:hypothetical protein